MGFGAKFVSFGFLRNDSSELPAVFSLRFTIFLT